MLIRFGGFLTVVAIAVWLWAIFDSLTAPADRIRRLPKAVWVILILLFFELGAIAWFAFGRPRAAASQGATLSQRAFGRLGGTPPPVPRRAIAPDDDPEFLRRLRDDLHRDPPDDPAR